MINNIMINDRLRSWKPLGYKSWLDDAIEGDKICYRLATEVVTDVVWAGLGWRAKVVSCFWFSLLGWVLRRIARSRGSQRMLAMMVPEQPENGQECTISQATGEMVAFGVDKLKLVRVL